MISIYLLVGVIILVILGYIIAFIYGSSEQIIFLPRRRYITRPKIPYKKVMIEDRLSAWHFHNFPGKKTVLFCHGNYGNISYNDFFIDICHLQELNLLIFDYSGYGHSHGIPSQNTVIDDGERAYFYLRKFVDPADIIVWGMSMGGAIAVYIASRNPCSSLILQSTFSSLDDIVIDSQIAPYAAFLLGTLGVLVDKMPSKNRIGYVQCPIAIMHSRDDRLIPFSNAQRLYDNISHSCKKFIEIKGGHISPVISNQILKNLFTFCCIDTSKCRLSKSFLQSLQKINEHWTQLEAQSKDLDSNLETKCNKEDKFLIQLESKVDSKLDRKKILN